VNYLLDTSAVVALLRYLYCRSMPSGWIGTVRVASRSTRLGRSRRTVLPVQGVEGVSAGLVPDSSFSGCLSGTEMVMN
jgi:hypothetical protein